MLVGVAADKYIGSVHSQLGNLGVQAVDLVQQVANDSVVHVVHVARSALDEVGSAFWLYIRL
jgi:hypothetical protein